MSEDLKGETDSKQITPIQHAEKMAQQKKDQEAYKFYIHYVGNC
jgi:hypothetical protein